jgi:hypothetical protein
MFMARTIVAKTALGQGLSLYSESGLSILQDNLMVYRSSERDRMRAVSGAAEGFSNRG